MDSIAAIYASDGAAHSAKVKASGVGSADEVGQPIVRITAGFHFDKWQLDWPRIARVTTMSPIYRSHSRSALALASARMLECSCRAIGIHAMSQFVVVSTNLAAHARA
jgi:hypothetical protein